eukprot:3146889-Rhodomonas_salina.1
MRSIKRRKVASVRNLIPWVFSLLQAAPDGTSLTPTRATPPSRPPARAAPPRAGATATPALKHFNAVAGVSIARR